MVEVSSCFFLLLCNNKEQLSEETKKKKCKEITLDLVLYHEHRVQVLFKLSPGPTCCEASPVEARALLTLLLLLLLLLLQHRTTARARPGFTHAQ